MLYARSRCVYYNLTRLLQGHGAVDVSAANWKQEDAEPGYE